MTESTLRSLVGILGLVVIISIVGAITLAAFERDIPGELWTVGTASLTALVGLLVPAPKEG